MLVEEILDVPNRPIPALSNEVHVASFVVNFNSTLTHEKTPFKPLTERFRQDCVELPPNPTLAHVVALIDVMTSF